MSTLRSRATLGKLSVRPGIAAAATVMTFIGLAGVGAANASAEELASSPAPLASDGVAPASTAAAAPAPAPAPAKAKFTICMATLNSSDEKDIFKQRLGSKDFEFVELTEMGSRGHHWFDAACESGIKCDVLAISGHFTGSFTGGGKRSLSLEMMERRQCDHSCDGILKNPEETFLFGCNTLATKDVDHRNKEIYLQVLKEHTKLRRLTRERTVESRYGAYGDNFAMRTRFALGGSRNVYGFWSVDPTGEQIRPFLEQYFSRKGDYASWLTQLEVAPVLDINRVNERGGARPLKDNPELVDAFSNLNFVPCGGLDRQAPDYADRARICQLWNASVPTPDKLRTVRDMATSGTLQRFLPNVEEFFRNNPPPYYSADATAALSQLRASPKGKADLLNAIQTGIGHEYRLSLIELGSQIGWFDANQRTDLRYDVLKRALPISIAEAAQSSSENFVCELPWEEAERKRLRAADVSPSTYQSAEGLRALGCIRPSDPAIIAEITKVAATANADPATDSGNGASNPYAYRSYSSYGSYGIADSAKRALQMIQPSTPSSFPYAAPSPMVAE